MKIFEIVIQGAHEEEIAHDIQAGIYAAVQNHGYTDVSVQAETVREAGSGMVEVPRFFEEYDSFHVGTERHNQSSCRSRQGIKADGGEPGRGSWFLYILKLNI